MKRWLALLLAAAMAITLLAGCGESEGDVTLETYGEGVPTEGRPVFYEFYTDG